VLLSGCGGARIDRLVGPAGHIDAHPGRPRLVVAVLADFLAQAVALRGGR
jgi:hypothetical protein